MNSVVGSSVSSDDVTPHASVHSVSLFRLYTLRAAYLVMAAGLGVYVWPAVIHHTNEFAVTRGIQVALLAGLGATAAGQGRSLSGGPAEPDPLARDEGLGRRLS